MLSRWPATAAVATVIFFLSEIPPPALPDVQPFLHADKLAHAAEYLLLGFCLYRSIAHELYARPRLSAIITGLCGTAFGALDEWHQGFTGRTPDGRDVLADVAGLGIGVLLAVLIRRQGKRHDG